MGSTSSQIFTKIMFSGSVKLPTSVGFICCVISCQILLLGYIYIIQLPIYNSYAWIAVTGGAVCALSIAVVHY